MGHYAEDFTGRDSIDEVARTMVAKGQLTEMEKDILRGLSRDWASRKFREEMWDLVSDIRKETEQKVETKYGLKRRADIVYRWYWRLTLTSILLSLITLMVTANLRIAVGMLFCLLLISFVWIWIWQDMDEEAREREIQQDLKKQEGTSS